MASLSAKLTLAIGVLATGTQAFWRMNCDFIEVGRIDPIINPGGLAAHAHTIVGGSNIGVNATYESMINSECNSCEIYPDKSSYWTPNLYYARPNGSFEEVPHTGSVIYYLGRGVTQDGRQDFVPFPKGFRMVSGKQAARRYNAFGMTWGNETYPANPIADAISFACLSDPLGPETRNIVDPQRCINGLRAQVHFQSCWNGVDLYKIDNSHVAYLNQLDNGVCPPGFDVLLPHIFMETNYGVTQLTNLNDGGYFVFSQGDPTGYGFHGDFFNAWNTGILKNAVENCISDDGFGTIEECPILMANRQIETTKNCPARPPQIGEPARGMLDKLPGCINITPGPESAEPADVNCGPDVVRPSITTTVDSTPYPTMVLDIGQPVGLPDYTYVGCGNDSVGSPLRTLNAAYTTNPDMSIGWCQAYCTSLGYRYSGIEYQIQCFCDLEINPTAQFYGRVNMSIGCDMTCPGDRSQLCGGSAYINVFKNEDPDFVPTNNTSGSAGQLLVPVAPFAQNYQGCASEGTSGRALNASAIERANMTLQTCAAYCAQQNTRFYGLEYYTQCFCGAGLASGSQFVDASTDPRVSACNTRCAGDFSQICGGGGVLSVYENTEYTPVVIVPAVGEYVASGCLTDPDPTKRSLAGDFYQDMDNMTVESCVAFCKGGGYRYAGIEYSYQCFCDNQVNPASGGVVDECPAGALLRVCSGNQYEYCGAGNLMQLYIAPP